jgi:two-component system, OmpR family, alkaline phosphatase synthesis response regulator PhoP
MAKEQILVVEDEEDIQQLVSFNLIKAGYHVLCAGSGEEGIQCLENEKVDCILLDLMLPGMNGLEFCRKIKKTPEYSSIPIIMLTAKGEEEDIVAGLEGGADDYVPKPFSPKVLIARMKAVLRRGGEKEENDEKNETILIHELRINSGRHEVQVDGKEVKLTITEFSILALLVGRPGWVFSRQQIIDAVRGYGYVVTPRAIDVQVFGLRKKLMGAGKYIETVRGIGYRFTD